MNGARTLFDPPRPAPEVIRDAQPVRVAPDAVEFVVPIRTVSELNVRESHFTRSSRAKKQKQGAWILCYVLQRVPWCGPAPKLARNRNLKGALAPYGSIRVPLTITLTRIAPGRLDDDNLRGSQKHIRDGIADALDVDDRTHLITWCYAERRGGPQEYGVHVRIEPTPREAWKPEPVRRGRR